MTSTLARCVQGVALIATLAANASAIVGAGSLATSPVNAGSPATHGWVAIPEPEGTRSIILHLPPRGVTSDRTGRKIEGPGGDARIATTLASLPIALGAIDNQLAMVFAEASGTDATSGRAVLGISVVQVEPGVWRATTGPRLETLPSLRGDGQLLGFSGSPFGYAALFQGLSGKGDDPKALVLQVLTKAGWTAVPVLAEAQTAAGASFELKDSKPNTKATWRLFATDVGVGIVAIPARRANEPIHGTVYLADFSGSQPGAAPSATWTQRELSIPVADSTPSDQVEVAGCGGHIVLTAAGTGGRVRVCTQPVVAPVAWREVAAVGGVAPDYTLVALDGVGRVGVVSHSRGKSDKEAPNLKIAEVSARTGSVLYEGPVSLGSPISRSDYRFVGLVLAYVTGLVFVFLWRPRQKDAQHLPPGVSIAEPGRRMLGGLIDLCIGVLIACRIVGIPVGEFLSSGLWTSGPAQNAMFITFGVLIVSGAVLETLFGRSFGKIITGCGVVEMQAGAPKDGKDAEAKSPRLWKSLVRNAVKWGLPPLALLGLLDAGGRHRGDQLAGTAVVIDGEDPEESTPDS